MIDPALEKKLEECKQIRECWRQFRDFFTLAVSKQPITHEKELEFLKVKSRLAILHDSYMEAIRSSPKTAQNIMIIVSRSITLKHVAELSIAETKKRLAQ
ncbi:MAG: hypothetical protein NTX50_03145 [Candidatus Sumerlaeota bacterium]|nr:hypothetical protein [Candidatus Sumerlaeota bacterium]